eukprot:110764-Amphidinium_carterae.1
MVNGQPSPVFKDPITDAGKASKKGRLTLQLASETTFPPEALYKSSKDSGVPGGTGYIHKYGDWITVAEDKGDKSKDKLVEVFRNGVLTKDRESKNPERRTRSCQFRCARQSPGAPKAHEHKLLDKPLQQNKHS